MSSAASSTATCLQLNVEPERGSAREFPFGMCFAGFSECRRRTSWSCFVLERLSGLFPSHIGVINKEDVFLSLPRDIQGFENQVDVATPPFEPHFAGLQQQRRVCPSWHVWSRLWLFGGTS